MREACKRVFPTASHTLPCTQTAPASPSVVLCDLAHTCAPTISDPGYAQTHTHRQPTPPTCSKEDDGRLGGSDSTEGATTLGMAIHLGDDDCTDLGGARQRRGSWLRRGLAELRSDGHLQAPQQLCMEVSLDSSTVQAWHGNEIICLMQAPPCGGRMIGLYTRSLARHAASTVL